MQLITAMNPISLEESFLDDLILSDADIANYWGTDTGIAQDTSPQDFPAEYSALPIKSDSFQDAQGGFDEHGHEVSVYVEASAEKARQEMKFEPLTEYEKFIDDLLLSDADIADYARNFSATLPIMSDSCQGVQGGFDEHGDKISDYIEASGKRSRQEMEMEFEPWSEDDFKVFDEMKLPEFLTKKAARQTVVTFYQRWKEILEVPEFSGRIEKLPEAFSSYFPGYIALSTNGIRLTQRALVRCIRGGVGLQQFDVVRAKEERKHLKKVLPAESLSKLEKVVGVLRLFDWVATCVLFMQCSPKYENLEKLSAVYPEFDRLCEAERRKLMDFANLLFSSIELFRCESSSRCHKCIQLDAITVITEGNLHSRGGDPTEFTILRDLIQQRESDMYFSAAMLQPSKNRKEGNAAVQRYVKKKTGVKPATRFDP